MAGEIPPGVRWHAGRMRTSRIWFTCFASLIGVLSLVSAISQLFAGGGGFRIWPWLTALAMGGVVMSQVFELRKQAKSARG